MENTMSTHYLGTRFNPDRRGPAPRAFFAFGCWLRAGFIALSAAAIALIMLAEGEARALWRPSRASSPGFGVAEFLWHRASVPHRSSWSRRSPPTRKRPLRGLGLRGFVSLRSKPLLRADRGVDSASGPGRCRDGLDALVVAPKKRFRPDILLDVSQRDDQRIRPAIGGVHEPELGRDLPARPGDGASTSLDRLRRDLVADRGFTPTPDSTRSLITDSESASR